MASEADLDSDLKSLSVLSDHPELYPEFAQLGCVASLVSLLAHENTDIAIDAIQTISELTDEDVDAKQDQWDSLVNAMVSHRLWYHDHVKDSLPGTYSILKLQISLLIVICSSTRISSNCSPRISPAWMSPRKRIERECITF
jgi:hypothetical protein